MIVVRGLFRGRLRLLLLFVLLGATVGLAPVRLPLAHAASVDSPFMLDDADCTGALTTGILALTLGGQFPSGAATVCAVILSDTAPADMSVGLTIYNSAGAAVSQSPSPTGDIDFGGAYELIWTGLADQAGAGIWPDGAYRTDISLNGTVSASVNWMVGAAPAPVLPTATPVPPTATPVPPTATAVPPTATAVPPTATVVPPTSTPTTTPLPPTATPTNTPHPPTATAIPRPLTDAKSLKPAKRRLEVGTTAPDFTLATIDGRRYHLAGLRGRPVVLAFFAVWSPQDQREAAVLTRLEAQYLPRNLQVLSILANPYGKAHLTTGSTQPAGSGDVAWFTKTFHIGHPILIDPHFAVVNRYGAKDTTLYVLNAKGAIRFVGTGVIPYRTLATAVMAAGAH